MFTIIVNQMEAVKMGDYTKSGKKRQRYKYESCGRTFVLNPQAGELSEEFEEIVIRAVVREEGIILTKRDF